MSSARLWLALAGVVLGFAAMLIWFGEGGTRGTPIRVAFAGPVSGVSDSLEIAFRANRVEFSMQMSRADAESFPGTGEYAPFEA